MIVAHLSSSRILSKVLSGLWMGRLKLALGVEGSESSPDPLSVDFTAYCRNMSVLPRLIPRVLRLLELGLLCWDDAWEEFELAP